MKLCVFAVGQRIPQWAEQACADYAQRLPAELQFTLRSVKTENRSGKSVAQCIEAEQARLRSLVQALGKNPRMVLLDERGAALRTKDFARKLHDWQQDAQPVALLLGGPDGFSQEFKDSAHQSIRLSDLTLPHALARVLLLEQIYRAWSLLNAHPYHRE